MSVMYMPHRGGLSESVKESREFDSFADMVKFIVDDHNDYWNRNIMSEDDIVIVEDDMGDDRIGWKDEFYICTKRYGDEKFNNPQCIGSCSRNYDKEVMDKWKES